MAGADVGVLRSTRVLAGVIIPFLVLAAFILLLQPQETARLFAWPINPQLTAMALGSTYAGGIVFFSRVLAARRWSAVALGFPAVAAFAGTLGVVTIIHWDRFTHDHVAFWVWTALYLTTPVLVLAAWLVNSRAAPRSPADPATVPANLRAVIAAAGTVLGVVGLWLLFLPGSAAAVWAWELSPLTARVVAATFLLPALVAIGIAVDGRWSSMRIPLEAQGAAALLGLISALVRREDLQGPDFAVAGFFIGLAGLLVATAALYLTARRRD